MVPSEQSRLEQEESGMWYNYFVAQEAKVFLISEGLNVGFVAAKFLFLSVGITKPTHNRNIGVLYVKTKTYLMWNGLLEPYFKRSKMGLRCVQFWFVPNDIHLPMFGSRLHTYNCTHVAFKNPAKSSAVALRHLLKCVWDRNLYNDPVGFFRSTVWMS